MGHCSTIHFTVFFGRLPKIITLVITLYLLVCRSYERGSWHRESNGARTLRTGLLAVLRTEQAISFPTWLVDPVAPVPPGGLGWRAAQQLMRHGSNGPHGRRGELPRDADGQQGR